MTSLLRPALVLFVLLTLLTGIAYPAAVTGIAQLLFPSQANGSVLLVDGKPAGSSLIGQEFSGEGGAKYFWGRLSATSPVPYAAFNPDKSTGSSGSNLGPLNPALTDNARNRIEALKAADAAVGYLRPRDQPVPVDLVTSSASGLDPHISIAAAEYQLPRVARARGMTDDRVRELLRAHTHARQLWVLGEPTVNVLEINLALEATDR
ncbi:MAG: potassium-transporting ATPase subunit KdpC [Phycisphaeraceae bacterium]|nr:potassium-transporting ATPase subunit KdpC [Phycisphaeraceae bacterium]